MSVFLHTSINKYRHFGYVYLNIFSLPKGCMLSCDYIQNKKQNPLWWILTVTLFCVLSNTWTIWKTENTLTYVILGNDSTLFNFAWSLLNNLVLDYQTLFFCVLQMIHMKLTVSIQETCYRIVITAWLITIHCHGTSNAALSCSIKILITISQVTGMLALLEAESLHWGMTRYWIIQEEGTHTLEVGGVQCWERDNFSGDNWIPGDSYSSEGWKSGGK
jgi:hypothetical protein